MRYLVTGCAGFLGSHLTKRLLDEGHHIVGMDNLSSSTGKNLTRFLNNDMFDFCQQDITVDPDKWFPWSREFDGIFNLACPASPPFYQNMPVETTLTCVVGAHHVLKLALENGCKILQTSTSEVYGDPSVSPQPETYRGSVNSFGPRACYDEGKRAAEALFYDYRKQYNVDIRIVRIFNTYGPNMLPDDGRVVSNFINQALLNHDITIYGDGKQTRSFAYVDDTIEGIMSVWNSNHNSPVNIGNPGEYSMLELAEKIISITNSSSKIVFRPLPVDDPMQRCPDITLAKSLGWRGPSIRLDSGLESTVQYFTDLLNTNISTRHILEYPEWKSYGVN